MSQKKRRASDMNTIDAASSCSKCKRLLIEPMSCRAGHTVCVRCCVKDAGTGLMKADCAECGGATRHMFLNTAARAAIMALRPLGYKDEMHKYLRSLPSSEMTAHEFFEHVLCARHKTAALAFTLVHNSLPNAAALALLHLVDDFFDYLGASGHLTEQQRYFMHYVTHEPAGTFLSCSVAYSDFKCSLPHCWLTFVHADKAPVSIVFVVPAGTPPQPMVFGTVEKAPAPANEKKPAASEEKKQ